MRALGSITACIELDNKYTRNVINLIVVDVEKQFGLLGSDIIISPTYIIIHVETVGVHTIIGCLEGYEA